MYNPLIDKSLVAWYPLAGNCLNRSGNGVDGVIVGPVTFGSIYTKLAANFTGGTQNISLTSGISGTNARTVTAWIYTTTTATEQTIYGSGTNSSSGFVFQININSAAAGRLYFWGNNADVYVNSVITANRWYHIAVTLPSNGKTNNIKLYVNGINRIPTIANSDVAINTYNGNYGIGHDCLNRSQSFQGGISDLRIYNRELSSGEIQRIYSSAMVNNRYQNNYWAAPGGVTPFYGQAGKRILMKMLGEM